MTKKKEKFPYTDLSAIHGIISEHSHSFLEQANKCTINHLTPMWTKHIKENHKNRMWKKQGSFIRSCTNIGVGKVIIGVGAGPSFKKNAHVLKFIHDHDAVKNWEDRDFIILSSNHQFKPLLKMGIVPDFVFLVDGSDMKSVYNQLCVDVPESGKGVSLVVPFHGSPSVIKQWTKNGGNVLFFLSNAKEMKEAFRKIVKKNPTPHAILSGGNVLNTMWMFGVKVFGSKIFFAMGNDLSFPIKKTKKEQEKGYYCDGDYSTNAKGTGSGRDEAACKKKWLSFKVQERAIVVPGKNNLEIVGADVVGTSHSLWVYKTWMEESMLLITKTKRELGFHYYNCSESGILGVMAKSTEDKEMKKNENWYMLDEVCDRWHTTTLEHAATQYLQAKEKVRWEKVGSQLGVQPATNLVHTN